MSGLAITHFCITSKPGLGYEFATLPGLSESVLDFSLNLKKVVLTGRVIDHEMQKITTLSSNLNNVRNTDYLFHSKRPLVPFEPKAQLRFQSPTYLTEGRSGKAQNIEGKSLSKHSKASIVKSCTLKVLVFQDFPSLTCVQIYLWSDLSVARVVQIEDLLLLRTK